VHFLFFELLIITSIFTKNANFVIMKRIIYLLFFLFTNTFLFAQNPLVQDIVNSINIDSLVSWVNKISGQVPVVVNGQQQIIATRQHQTFGNEIAFQYLKSELVRYGYEIDSLEFNINGKNLYGIKYGTKFPNHWWMLGAHYDNLPLTEIAPGADDNASGCATVLEAARLFSKIDFPYTIVFALWDEEEPGLFGSSKHIERIGTNNETLLGYINLDMIAWDSNNDYITDIHTRPIKLSQIMTEKAVFCNETYDIKLNLNIVNPGNYNSDQKPFWESNQAAIAINEHYLYDLNPHMHTQNDKIEHFNMNYFLRNSKLSIATIAELALDTKSNFTTNNINIIYAFPNPFKTHITLQTPSKDSITYIEVVNCMGETIYQQEMGAVENSENTTDLNLIFLQSGVYFLRIYTDKNTYTERIIKLNYQR